MQSRYSLYGVIAGILLAGAMWVAPIPVFARVLPAVIDIEVHPHEEAYFDVTIVNDAGHVFRVSPMVGEIDAQSGSVTISGTPYDGNRLISANIEIPRDDFGLAPGASRSLRGKINVSPYISAGVYHAVVAFVPEYYEPGTGIILPAGTPRALLNVTVRKDIRERLNLTLFRALRKVFLRFPAKLAVDLHNGGNIGLNPDINVSFFDRRDRERGSIPVEVSADGIAANNTATVPIAWDGDAGFGRYRAQIQVQYGRANGGQVLAASTTFWIIPVWLLVLIVFLMVVLSYGAARMIVRGTKPPHAD